MVNGDPFPGVFTRTAAFGRNAPWTAGWGHWCCHGSCHSSLSETTSVPFIFFDPSKRIENPFHHRQGQGISVGFTGNSALSHIIEWETEIKLRLLELVEASTFLYWRANADLKYLNFYTLGRVPALIRVSIYWAFIWARHSKKLIPMSDLIWFSQ